MNATSNYNIFNHGARVYSDTQTQTQPATTKATQPTPTAQAAKVETAKAAVAPTQAEKVSISDSGRAAVAQNKDGFVNAIMKAGYSREAAEARFKGLQSQRDNHAATNVANTSAASSSASTSATPTTSLTQPVSDTSKTSNTSANATSSQPENKALDRFVNGFTKSGYTKDQAINAYNMYAALARQQSTGVRS